MDIPISSFFLFLGIEASSVPLSSPETNLEPPRKDIPMKKSALLVLASVLTISSAAFANSYTGTGTVATIHLHDSVNWPVGATPQNWAALAGFTSAGNCRTSGGLVVIKIRDDDRGKQHTSTLTAAKLAGRSVTVDLDDTQITSDGWCILQWMSLN
jgi:hypothetical protein